MLKVRSMNNYLKTKEIALSILAGEPVRKCAEHNGISEIKCISILHKYCSISNRDVYLSLCCWGVGRGAPIFRLRQYAQKFIDGAKHNEKITFNTSILAIPEVPAITLNALYENGITNIDKFLQVDMCSLLKIKGVAKYGIGKLIKVLKEFGFLIGT